MNALPYRLLRASEAATLSARAAAALARWGARWAALPDHGTSCADACGQASAFASDSVRRVLTNGQFAWFQLPAGAGRAIEQLLFGLDDMDAASERHLDARLAVGTVNGALEELQQMLLDALCGQASSAAAFEAPPAVLLRRGSGSAVCTVTLGPLAIRILLPAALLPAAPPPRALPGAAPLATLHHALACLPVPLTVEVCRTELTLGYLRTLAVGDVLALPVGLDQPLRVAGPGDSTVCHAHLGALAGYYAAELMKPAP